MIHLFDIWNVLDCAYLHQVDTANQSKSKHTWNFVRNAIITFTIQLKFEFIAYRNTVKLSI